MRSIRFLAALAVGCAISQPALAQPGPSGADPSEYVGPSLELPAPIQPPPSNGGRAAQFPTPNYSPRPGAPLSGPALSPPLAPSPMPGQSPARSLAPSPAFEPIGPAVVAEPTYASPIAASVSPAPQDAPPEISPNAEKWRYKWSDGRWWYKQPSGRWSYWSAGRWVEYSPSRYSNTPANLHPPVTPRRWALGRRPPAAPNPAPPVVDYGPSGGGPSGYGPSGGAGVY